jgi:exopolysaccharide biosynthesis polyprenyl glycosylphosphotransferase
MNYKLQVLKYILFDYISAATTWILFFIFRKIYIESEKFGMDMLIVPNKGFNIGLLLIPLFWLLLYYLSGYYKDVFRKSRLKDIGQTFFQSLIGVIFLFFTVILDDEIISYKNYYLLFSVLLAIHFLLCLIPRYILTSATVKKLHKRLIGFNTIIIGSNSLAVDIFLEMENQVKTAGNQFIGFLQVNNENSSMLEKYLKRLGTVNEINEALTKYAIEEVIIAIEPDESEEISRIYNTLVGKNVIIKAIPSTLDILTGKVKMTHIFGTPLIQLSHDTMPVWHENLKQVLDLFVSVLALLILSPLIIILSIGVRWNSPGPVIYSHERIGRYGKPFKIYKFRSMYSDSEKNGPLLSSKSDKRLTPFGRFMRKYKFDEIPNFINVLKGEMSLVGPRPERKYFIDKILPIAPHYVHLHKVKPGITSWGQVKYGYAENVEQMIKRMRYDILYIENMSLFVDFKILFYTALTILRGKGI